MGIPHVRPIPVSQDQVKFMPPIDLRELAPQNRSEHYRRLQRIKRSLERQNYEVDPEHVASGIIQEALSDAEYRHPGELPSGL